MSHEKYPLQHHTTKNISSRIGIADSKQFCWIGLDTSKHFSRDPHPFLATNRGCRLQAWCVTPCGHDTCHNSAGPPGSFMEHEYHVTRGEASDICTRFPYQTSKNDEHKRVKVDNPLPFNGEFSKNPRSRIQGLGLIYNHPRYWHCACGQFAPLKLDNRTINSHLRFICATTVNAATPIGAMKAAAVAENEAAA